ncbi:MAG: pentapeptide repeat-containing protein [Chloroflexota bacterium]
MASARRDDIQSIHQQYLPFYNIGGGLALILIGIWIGSLIFTSGYFTNVYTEALSVIATIVVLDRLNDWREERRLKARLRREATSRDNSTALNAIDWLRAENWLTLDNREHLLREQKLSRANLQDAYLYQADLENCNFYKSTLRDADISKANLRGAYLHNANLANASAFGTDFRGACLWYANMRNMRHLDKAIFDETTILPDSRPLYDENGEVMTDDNELILFDFYWTPEIDMSRYTNPEHRDFWDAR